MEAARLFAFTPRGRPREIPDFEEEHAMVEVWLPTNQEVQGLFREELDGVGGSIKDCFDDARRLYLRSVLPEVRHVRHKDGIQGGVALLAAGPDVRVCPYTFRQVCSNGAVLAHTVGTRSVQRLLSDAPQEDISAVAYELREAVRECSAAEVFSEAVDQMRSASHRHVDRTIELLSFLSRISTLHLGDLIDEIARRFAQEHDRSMYGLMNAVTSLARDQSDAHTRWQLEELGGLIPALAPPRAPRGLPRAATARRRAPAAA